jgi:nucleosome-remodeling factor subunit BPTF
MIQKQVLGIIPTSQAGGAQTFASFQPRTTTINIRPGMPGSPQQVTPHGTSFPICQSINHIYL